MKAARLTFIRALLSGVAIDQARAALAVAHALSVRPVLALPAPVNS